MVEASQWYSLISVGSSSLALLAAAYVVRKIPNRRAGDTFVLAMVFFVLAGTFAYLLRTSTLDYYGTNSGPLAIARLFYFFHMLAVGFTASFIGQYFLGFELMRRRLVNLFLQVSLLIVAIGVTTQVTTLEDEYGGIGVVVEDAWARGSLALFATLFMSTALAVLVRTLIRNKDPTVRKQAILMTAGVVIHGTGAESYAYLRIFADMYPPPYLTITAFTMAALLTVAVLRYRMFVVSPQKEEPVGVPRRFDLKAGHAYAIRERRPHGPRRGDRGSARPRIRAAGRAGKSRLRGRRRIRDRGRWSPPNARKPFRWCRDRSGRHGGHAHGDHEFRARVVRRRRGRAAPARARRPDRRHRAKSQVHPRGRDDRQAIRRGPGGNADLPGTRGAPLWPPDGQVDRDPQEFPGLQAMTSRLFL